MCIQQDLGVKQLRVQLRVGAAVEHYLRHRCASLSCLCPDAAHEEELKSMGRAQMLHFALSGS